MLAGVRRFDDFELDSDAFRLTRDGQIVRLERIPLELLCLLVERRGQTVTRDDILERIWGKGSSSIAKTSSARRSARFAAL
jgi:DNA-binding response OmpR family regulator